MDASKLVSANWQTTYFLKPFLDTRRAFVFLDISMKNQSFKKIWVERKLR